MQNAALHRQGTTIGQVWEQAQQINGWCSEGAAHLFAFMNHCQVSEGITGNIFEIGAHCGKSAVLLASFLRNQERLGVCDVFDGGSDENDARLQQFLNNVQTIVPGTPLDIYKQNSHTLAEANLAAPFRMFHIDGGHEAKDVDADMRTAHKFLAQNGVMILDDMLCMSWPTVMDGCVQFMNDHREEWSPILLGFNKGVFVRRSHRHLYDKWCLDENTLLNFFGPDALEVKQSSFFADLVMNPKRKNEGAFRQVQQPQPTAHSLLRPDELEHIWPQIDSIPGWFEQEAAQLITYLHAKQKEHGVHGNVFEIGAHRGRSAALLAAFCSADERLGICDIFDESGGSSLSGAGRKEESIRNIQAVAPDVMTDVYAKSSNQLRPEELHSPFRIFHIDGGHSKEETLNDLRIGSVVTADMGMIILDDCLNYNWPSVIDGCMAFMQEHGNEWSPVVVAFNKGIFVRRHAKHIYDDWLRDNDQLFRFINPNLWYTRESTLFNERVLSFFDA